MIVQFSKSRRSTYQATSFHNIKVKLWLSAEYMWEGLICIPIMSDFKIQNADLSQVFLFLNLKRGFVSQNQVR